MLIFFGFFCLDTKETKQRKNQENIRQNRALDDLRSMLTPLGVPSSIHKACAGRRHIFLPTLFSTQFPDLFITHAFIILIGVRESGKARFRTSHAHMALVNLSAVDFQRADFRFNNLTI